MPTYQYLENGRIVERTLPVAQRDEFPGRITVPTRVRVLTNGGKTEAEWQAEEVLRGFYRLEQKDPNANDKMREGLGMTPAQIRDVWAQPDEYRPQRPGEILTKDDL